MLTSFIRKVNNFWKNGHNRTLAIKKNIIYSILIKGASVLLGFVLFPLTIHYVNSVQYGIWLTIASLVAWVNTFDVGLSNGLRNKLAHSLALGEKDNIVKYTSTTYAMLFFIVLTVFSVFFLAGSFFNWNQLLHLQNAINYNIWPIILLSLGFFCLQFVLQPINTILIATHQPFKSSLLFLAGQLLTLILTCILIRFTHGNLFILVFVVAGSPVLVLLCGSLYFFKKRLTSFIPRFSRIDFKSAKSLLNLGSAFFFIQIGALVLYETDNIIITRTLGPYYVTTFNIAYKYFSILIIAFSIIVTPYWSAFTDAYAKNDFEWIRVSIRKLRLLWLYTSVLALLLYFFSDIFYRLWIGNAVSISKPLSLSIAIYVVFQNWMVIQAYLLNGVGKLRIQLILVIATSFLNIPLSVLLINRVGLHGTVIANVVVVAIINIFLTYQCKLIVDKKAAGIWNK